MIRTHRTSGFWSITAAACGWVVLTGTALFAAPAQANWFDIVGNLAQDYTNSINESRPQDFAPRGCLELAVYEQSDLEAMITDGRTKLAELKLHLGEPQFEEALPQGDGRAFNYQYLTAVDRNSFLYNIGFGMHDLYQIYLKGLRVEVKNDLITAHECYALTFTQAYTRLHHLARIMLLRPLSSWAQLDRLQKED